MKKEHKTTVKGIPQEKADLLFAKYAAIRQHPSHQLISFVCIPLLLFSLLGIAWSLPFPHLAFLGQYNGFLNWASFLIAIAGYYFYRLSPVLSYMMLLLIFVLSIVTVQFEKWAAAGGPSLWLVSVFALLFSAIALFIGRKIEGKPFSFADFISSLFSGPVWMLQFLRIKTGLKRN